MIFATAITGEISILHCFLGRKGKDMKRQAFTLVELLIVVAIMGVLMSLLVPAVQQARDAARRLQCLNNVKQLAGACSTGLTVHDRFPSAGWSFSFVGDPDRGYGVKQPGSWSYSILPYLEQQPLFLLGQDSKPNEVTPQQMAGAAECCKHALKVFSCPSRRSAIGYPFTGSANIVNASLQKETDLIGKSDYAASVGTTGEVEDGNTPGDFNTGVSWEQNRNWPERENTGLMYHHSAVRSDHVVDGLTNTYLLGEKYLNPDNYETGIDLGDNECIYCGYDNDNCRSGRFVSDTDNRRPVQDRRGYSNTDRFGSTHTGSFVMAMGDSSAHWISYAIDPQLHANLANRQDRQQARLPD